MYVQYMPLDPGLAGDCIGYDAFEGEFGSYVCKVEGLPETEWICDVSSDVMNGHTACMIMKEINVKKVPDLFASGEKYDADAAYKAASDFVTNYNETLDAVNKTTNAAVSSAAGSMTRMTGVMTKSLGGIGISVGKDGRMSINEDEFKNAGFDKVKSMLGTNGSFARIIGSSAQRLSSAAEQQSRQMSLGNTGTYGRYGSYLGNYGYSGSRFNGWL